MKYRNGVTGAFLCGWCGGWIPGYSVFEKEVWEQGVLDGERVCDCGSYDAIRDEMLAAFNQCRADALRRFRQAAERLNLPEP